MYICLTICVHNITLHITMNVGILRSSSAVEEKHICTDAQSCIRLRVQRQLVQAHSPRGVRTTGPQIELARALRRNGYTGERWRP